MLNVKTMRIKFVLLLICGIASLKASAHGLGTISLVNERRWTAVQIGIWPLQLFDKSTDVYGLNCNLFLTYQNKDVYGLSIAPFNFCCGDVKGITIGLDSIIEGPHSGVLVSLVSHVSSNNGIQIGLLNRCKENFGDGDNCGGLQIGLFNDSDASGFQIGLLNHNSKAWLKWLPLCNFRFGK
jgi:hypothetical protein